MKKGAIFTVNDDDKTLEMAAQIGLHEYLRSACKKVPFGKCLCGRAAESKGTVFFACVDDRHEISYEGISPHGHYCTPIVSKDKVLEMY